MKTAITTLPERKVSLISSRLNECVDRGTARPEAVPIGREVILPSVRLTDDRLSATPRRARTTFPPRQEGKSADKRRASTSSYSVFRATQSSLASTASETTPLRNTRCRATKDANTSPWQICRGSDNARRPGPEPSASWRPRQGGCGSPPR